MSILDMFRLTRATEAQLDRVCAAVDRVNRRHHRECRANLDTMFCHPGCEKDDAFRERIKEGLADG